MNKNKIIPVEGSFAKWRKDPDDVKACYALEDEFSHAADMIKVRVNRRVLDDILCQRADKQSRRKKVFVRLLAASK